MYNTKLSITALWGVTLYFTKVFGTIITLSSIIIEFLNFNPIQTFCLVIFTIFVIITFEVKFMKFSVIIPIYNAESTIKRCINSFISQAYSDFEIILVNDGSSDSSEEIILSFKSDKIKYIKKENGGVSSARNC